ncbi:MAG: hypothetical protein Q8S57_07115 [Methanoregula sp.]|nr:hypothetical protein [Methanoregula sp.]
MSGPLTNIDKACDKTKASMAQIAVEAKKAQDAQRNVFLAIGAGLGVGGYPSHACWRNRVTKCSV